MLFPTLLSTALLLSSAAAIALPVTSDTDEPAADAVLTDAEVAEYPALSFGADITETAVEKRSGYSYGGGYGGGGQRRCKTIPGDSQWPGTSLWNLLDNFTGGDALEKPAPIGSVCYAGAGMDAAKCASVTENWFDSSLHAAHPSSIMWPLFQGLTCLPQDGPSGTCTRGGYPVYVLTARNPRDVQLAVNFARNRNIRLVVKNTGHDFSGKSSGSSSLSVRTHKLKDIEFFAHLNKYGHSGPAFKVGAGVQGFEIYKAASDNGVAVVGGEGQTVGWGGGYIQGGGHSPLSNIHGMAADHVLAYEVVLANGRFVTADADTHSDVFWALRGGGGSTFGVITSILVKAHADLPTTTSIFNFTASPSDIAAAGGMDDFWAVVKEYFKLMPAHTDAGIYSYFNIFPTAGGVAGQQTFTMLPFFAPGKTVAEVNSALAPVFAKAAALNVAIDPYTVTYPSFYPAWVHGFPKERVGTWNTQPGSRLFPRASWSSPSTFDPLFAAIKAQTLLGGLIGIKLAPTLAKGGNPDNAVNPSWRSTVFHGITFAMWNDSLRDPAAIRENQRVFTEVNMQRWREVAPGMGAYLSEADRNEPEFQHSFWGNKYERLYGIKQHVDPEGVFYASLAVGSEDWSAGVDHLGRLCPV
ncbi:FAD/FMN-containing isoamyl alcohol oxidase-like protein MreA [Geopyxis carbonaria]|nr:FAD/FMN-containing isoamyl alcohol oxidase-like protein MreA [Geopyxis carbonaria]